MRARSRLLFGTVFVALLLAASALPGSAAPEKIFRLDISPTSAAAGSATTFTAKFTNITPGNSTFNSVTLTAPAGFTVHTASITASSTSQTAAVVTVQDRTVTVTGLSAVKRNEHVTLSVGTTVGGGGSCIGGSGTWSAQAWTGSNTAGNTFRLAQGTGLTTTITADCTLQFVQGRTPSDGIKNQVIQGAGGNVQVELLNGGSLDTSFSGSVSLSVASGPSEANLSGATEDAVNGVATFANLKLDTEGTYTLQASSGSLTSDPSPAFTIFGGGIDCSETVEFSGEGTDVTLERTDEGPSSGCEEVPFSMAVHATQIDFPKDGETLRQQGATFVLTITWSEPPGEYPDFGETTFDIDFDGPIPPFTPVFCDRVDGAAQYPNNPSGDDYWPAGEADQPWCVDEVIVNGDTVTERYLGSGDPVIRRS